SASSYTAKRRLKTFTHIRNVLEENGGSVTLAHQDRSHFRSALEQSQASDIDVLRSELKVIAARVLVTGRDSGKNLRKRGVVLEQFARINLRLILPGGSAEGSYVDDAGRLLEFAAHKPVLLSLDLIQGVAGAFQLIAVYLADRRPRRELRLEVLRQ